MVDGLRRALYCLLLIALPFQAFASGGMKHCTSMQMTFSRSIGMTTVQKDNAVGMPQQGTLSGVSAGITGCAVSAQGSRSSDGSAAHCAGMACCGGVAAASVVTLPLFLRMLANGTPFVAHLSPHVRFLTGAPERPPRTAA